MRPKRTERLVIGPSTGWMYARGIYSLDIQETILKQAGARAAEICLGGWASDDKRMMSLNAGRPFEVPGLRYRSMHLPDMPADVCELAGCVEAVKAISVRHGIETALVHPLKIGSDYPARCFEAMVSAGVPLAVENMDPRKDSGFAPEELERLVDGNDLRFVLDVQHAYEHDSSMQYACDLFAALSGSLVHLHVSGETEDKIHALVHQARNARAIVAFLADLLAEKRVPLILEGEYANAQDLRQEIEFLRKELEPVVRAG